MLRNHFKNVERYCTLVFTVFAFVTVVFLVMIVFVVFPLILPLFRFFSLLSFFVLNSSFGNCVKSNIYY